MESEIYKLKAEIQRLKSEATLLYDEIDFRDEIIEALQKLATGMDDAVRLLTIFGDENRRLKKRISTLEEEKASQPKGE